LKFSRGRRGCGDTGQQEEDEGQRGTRRELAGSNSVLVVEGFPGCADSAKSIGARKIKRSFGQENCVGPGIGTKKFVVNERWESRNL
jgi:hypothetical protein